MSGDRGSKDILADENKADREKLVEMLTKAYWMEIETVMSYVTNSVNPDGVRASEIKASLAADITEEEIRIYQTAELTGFELFNLRDDIGETKDLSREETARYEGMKEALLKKYHEVREESPVWPAWEWPRYEGHRIVWPEYKPLIKPPK